MNKFVEQEPVERIANNTAVAKVNDEFRSQIAVPLMSDVERVPGQVVMTRPVAQASPEDRLRIFAAVRGVETFEAENDPYGEHDFGAVQIEGLEDQSLSRLFWKIDVYEDSECRFGAEHPESAVLSYRVLTIMRPEDY